MLKQIFKIPVEWAVCDIISIEAETLEEAIGIVLKTKDEIPLGTEPEYIDGSYKIEGEDEFGERTEEEFIKSLAEYLTELGYNETL